MIENEHDSKRKINSKRHATVTIIGSGIVGASIANILSEYGLSVNILEKSADVCAGASKANSGVVHGAYAAGAETVKGELSIRGNRMYKELSERLGFPYNQIGSYVLAFTEAEEQVLHSLRERSRMNGVNDAEIIPGRLLCKREPCVNSKVKSALYSPETGIVSPYEATIALIENAIENGASLFLNSEVHAIENRSRYFDLFTASGVYHTELVINAAGIYADKIEELLGLKTFRLIPRKGEYMVLRRGSADGIHSVLFQIPGKQGKGVLVTPTCWNNLLLGPNAETMELKEDRSTSIETVHNILHQAWRIIPSLKARDVIRTFAGIRSTPTSGDFIIEQTEIEGFINVVGIESPGLTAAPAIAEKICSMLRTMGYISPRQKRNPSTRRVTHPLYSLQPMKEIRADIERSLGDPARIVCRCEQVREEQIKCALNGKIPINSFNGIKFYTRAGMGACQGEFCSPRVLECIQHYSKKKRILPSRTSSSEVLQFLHSYQKIVHQEIND